MSPSGWIHNFKLPKWVETTDNPLEEMLVFGNSSSYHSNITLHNTGVTPSSAEITPTSEIELYTEAMDLVENIQYSGSKYTTVGQVPAGETYTWNNIYAARSGASDIMDYTPYLSITEDSFTVSGTSNAAFGFSSQTGNVNVNINTNAGAGLFVVYKYGGVDLPLSLQSFTAKAENTSALINWTATSDGTPDEFFAVEHSIDGKNFSEIGTVNANWESKSAENYQFRHLMPAIGKNFYRLRLHEASGKTEYSNVATVTMGKGQGSVSVFPNPANSELNIDGANTLSSIKLFSSTGAPVQTPVRSNGDRTTLQTSQLPAGIYFLQLTANDGSTTNQRILIQHP